MTITEARIRLAECEPASPPARNATPGIRCPGREDIRAARDLGCVLRAAGATFPDTPAPYYARVPTRNRRNLIEACFGVLSRFGVSTETLTVMKDESRAGWQQVTLVTRPCRHAEIAGVVTELGAGEPAVIAPIRR